MITMMSGYHFHDGVPPRRHPKRDVHEPRHDTRPAIITFILSTLATYGWLAHMIWSMT